MIKTLSQVEKEYILKLYKEFKTGDNNTRIYKTKFAKILAITRGTLDYKLKQYSKEDGVDYV